MGLKTKILISGAIILALMESTTIRGGIIAKLSVANGGARQIEASITSGRTAKISEAEKDTGATEAQKNFITLSDGSKIKIDFFAFRPPTDEEIKTVSKDVFTSKDTKTVSLYQRMVDRLLSLKEGDDKTYQFFKIERVDRQGLNKVSKLLRNLQRGYSLLYYPTLHSDFPPEFELFTLDQEGYHHIEVLTPGAIRIVDIKSESITKIITSGDVLALAGMQLMDAHNRWLRKLRDTELKLWKEEDTHNYFLPFDTSVVKRVYESQK